MTPPPHELYQSKLFPGSSHSWALERITSIPGTARILDIGSGSGVMGRQLKMRGFQNLNAVEVSAEAREATSQFYSVMAPSLDELSNSEPYDLVLLLDVIEHMTDPDQFLQKLTQYLRPGGRLLISVPNVAHWAIRLMLVAGYFEYMERGPLDKTHFRFFTKRGLTKLLNRIPRLELRSVSGSIVPLELMLPEMLWKNPVFAGVGVVRMRLANALPSLFAYQLLAEVVRK